LSLKRKPKGRRNIRRKKGVRELETKTLDGNWKYVGRVQTMNAPTTSMVQEIRNTMSTSRAYLNERNRKNKCSSGQKLLQG